MAPLRRTKRKRAEEGPSSPALEESPPENPRVPSGHPFVDKEIEWNFTRDDLADRPHKTMLTGYETMVGDVRAVLASLPIRVVDKVTLSAIGPYAILTDYSLRCGKMMHYVIFREVEPSPYFDKTALWFNIGEGIIRFSRVEYTLVSGLHFGHSSFNPYEEHALPEGSIYERLFGANPETTLSVVRTAFVDKHFTVDDVKVVPTIDDYVKLAKFLLTLNYALGLDQTKKKIPLCMWVLLEDPKGWEEFPWGSYSYQLLVHSIRSVVRRARETKSGKICYHLKGNTLAFCAWIFEAIPTFGRVVGAQNAERVYPRFLRYKYMKERKYPTDDEITSEVKPLLKPHKKELKTKYWATLMDDPERMPFALVYNAKKDGTKRRPRGGNADEQADDAEDMTAATTGTIPLTAADLKHVAKTAAEAAAKLIENLLELRLARLVDDVADKVVARLLERTTEYDSHDMTVGPGEPSVLDAEVGVSAAAFQAVGVIGAAAAEGKQVEGGHATSGVGTPTEPTSVGGQGTPTALAASWADGGATPTTTASTTTPALDEGGADVAADATTSPTTPAPGEGAADADPTTPHGEQV